MVDLLEKKPELKHRPLICGPPLMFKCLWNTVKLHIVSGEKTIASERAVEIIHVSEISNLLAYVLCLLS